MYRGKNLSEVPLSMQAAEIAFVLQSPDNQIVTDKVWHELAFALENLGADNDKIKKRISETAAFFGIGDLFYKNTADLSGGQKQLLNLAAAMTLDPSVLILDEPTSQLDPIAAYEFLQAVNRVNRELGVTVIMTEHRLQDALAFANRVAVMENGRLIADASPSQVGSMLKDTNNGIFNAMPAAMRIYAAVPNNLPCPVSVADGRLWLEKYCAENTLKSIPEEINKPNFETVISAHQLHFAYDGEKRDAINGLNLKVGKGEFLTLLGSNGTGKTTLLKLFCGILKSYSGELSVSGSVGYLPQNPQALFVKKTVRQDLASLLEKSDENAKKLFDYAVNLCEITELLDRHPFDLSGGEQQRAALAKILIRNPDILLLDEPTKGMDAEFKRSFASIIKTLTASGKTVVAVSHDMEFCAQYADKCALIFAGEVISCGTPRSVLCNNRFYTTAAYRIAGGRVDNALTVNDVIYACTGKAEEPPPIKAEIKPVSTEHKNDETLKKLPVYRKIGAAICAVAALFVVIRVLYVTNLSAVIKNGELDFSAVGSLKDTVALCAALIGLNLFVTPHCAVKHNLQNTGSRKLTKRTIAACMSVLVFIPLTIFIGAYYLDSGRYLFISLLIMLECMIPFFAVFEGRKPQPRELVLIAAICAINIVGRTAFFMLPQFKPVLALTIISGVALGAESGFLVGALTMFASNMLFSQGPWTPWQMFAMGIIGFLAGVLFKKGLLSSSKLSLCVFGALSAVMIYGLIMNSYFVLFMPEGLNFKIWLTYIISGLPMDCVHAAATVVFLCIAAEPMLEKLERIKKKYGLRT